MDRHQKDQPSISPDPPASGSTMPSGSEHRPSRCPLLLKQTLRRSTGAASVDWMAQSRSILIPKQPAAVDWTSNVFFCGAWWPSLGTCLRAPKACWVQDFGKTGKSLHCHFIIFPTGNLVSPQCDWKTERHLSPPRFEHESSKSTKLQFDSSDIMKYLSLPAMVQMSLCTVG